MYSIYSTLLFEDKTFFFFDILRRKNLKIECRLNLITKLEVTKQLYQKTKQAQVEG